MTCPTLTLDAPTATAEVASPEATLTVSAPTATAVHAAASATITLSEDC